MANRPKILRCFVWTLNNYTEDEVESINNNEITQYICYGREIGKNGTPHLQGYAEMKKRTLLKTIKKTNGFSRMHIEKRRGNQTEAIEYCKKDGIFSEFGEKKEPGKRNDIKKIKQLAKEEGTTMTEIANAATSYQSLRMGEKLLSIYEPKRTEKTHVTWIHGPTGSGKSTLAFKLLGEDWNKIYLKNEASKWFNGYCKNKNVLFDDFRANWMPLSDLLTLLYWTPRQVETKGDFRQFVAEKIVITSIYHPLEVYKNKEEGDEDMQQLMRRIEKVITLTSPDQINEWLPTQEDDNDIYPILPEGNELEILAETAIIGGPIKKRKAHVLECDETSEV